MKRITIAVIFVLLICIAQGQDPRAISDAAHPKPELKLTVKADTIEVAQKDGRTCLHFDVLAGTGWKGTVSGSISIAEPFNPDRVELSEGFAAKNVDFKLAADQKLSELTEAEDLTYCIRTSQVNPKDGTLIYTIFLNAPDQVAVRDAPNQLTLEVGNKVER